MLHDSTSFVKSQVIVAVPALVWQKVRDYAEVMIFDSFDRIFEFITSPVPIYCGIPPPR